jgi:hypothetical protein
MGGESETVHVATAPPEQIDADLVKQVAALVNKQPYDARVLLAGHIPRIMAQFPGVQQAESVAQALRGLGLVAVVCKDSELRKPADSFVAKTAEFRDGEVAFTDRSGSQRTVESGRVLLMLKGRIQVHVEQASAKSKMKFSPTATVLTGGIPIWRRVTENVTEQSLKSEDFLRLYHGESSDPRVDLLMNHTDYSTLGDEKAATTPANFNILVGKIRAAFPQVNLDDRLMRPFDVDVPTAEPQDALEINCKLLWLYHRAVSCGGS